MFGEQALPLWPAPSLAVSKQEKGFSVCFRALAGNEKNKLVYVAMGTSNQHKGPADLQQPEHDSVLPHKETLGQHF